MTGNIINWPKAARKVPDHPCETFGRTGPALSDFGLTFDSAARRDIRIMVARLNLISTLIAWGKYENAERAINDLIEWSPESTNPTTRAALSRWIDAMADVKLLEMLMAQQLLADEAAAKDPA